MVFRRLERPLWLSEGYEGFRLRVSLLRIDYLSRGSP
jgi:hypothetical protein